jgi:hypothetical protein
MISIKCGPNYAQIPLLSVPALSAAPLPDDSQLPILILWKTGRKRAAQSALSCYGSYTCREVPS